MCVCYGTLKVRNRHHKTSIESVRDNIISMYSQVLEQQIDCMGTQGPQILANGIHCAAERAGNSWHRPCLIQRQH
jgi:hypothetical protein